MGGGGADVLSINIGRGERQREYRHVGRVGWWGDRDRISTWRDKESMDIERGQTESIDIEGGTEYRHRGWDRDSIDTEGGTETV